MFYGGLSESVKGEIEIPIKDIHSDIFWILLRWLYGQKDAIPDPDNFKKGNKYYTTDYLTFLVDIIRTSDIYDVEQLKSEAKDIIIRGQYISVRNLYKISLRVAAVIILFLCLATIYKYSSVSNQSFYNKQFSGYELGNTRGVESHDPEADAYRNNKWNDVISIYNAGINKSNQQSFLAAMAEMQLNHFQNAVIIFEGLLNSKTSDVAYVDECEYYLSLAYLMNNEGDKAIQMINKIKANPNHTYYPVVTKLSSIDLKIIELKNK